MLPCVVGSMPIAAGLLARAGHGAHVARRWVILTGCRAPTALASLRRGHKDPLLSREAGSGGGRPLRFGVVLEVYCVLAMQDSAKAA